MIVPRSLDVTEFALEPIDLTRVQRPSNTFTDDQIEWIARQDFAAAASRVPARRSATSRLSARRPGRRPGRRSRPRRRVVRGTRAGPDDPDPPGPSSRTGVVA